MLIVHDMGATAVSGTFHGNTVGDPATANSGSLEGSDLKVQTAGLGSMTVRVT